VWANELSIGSGYLSTRISGYFTKYFSSFALNGVIRYYLNGTKTYEDGATKEIGEWFAVYSEINLNVGKNVQIEPGISFFTFAGNFYKSTYSEEKYDGGWRVVFQPNLSYAETKKLVYRGGLRIPLAGNNSWKWYGIVFELNYLF